MSATKKIRLAMIEKNIKPGTLADVLEIEKQSFYNKLQRDKMSFSDVETIAAAMGYNVVFQDMETGKIIG